MAGAVTETERERDRALHRIQVLAAEIRAHEEATRGKLALPRRHFDDRLYRRLRQINGGGDDASERDGLAGRRGSPRIRRSLPQEGG
jgi:hypothetical protein